jgi:ribonuclease BN (tRNA processing enzyme)
MDLIVLGAGTSIPLTYLASPSLAFLINDRYSLLDLGPGTLRQLAKAGINHKNIDRVFITHFHPDHTADLIHLLFVTRNPSVLKIRKPFSIIGPNGLKDLIENLRNTYGNWLDIRSDIMLIRELDILSYEKIDFGDFYLTSKSVNHTPQSLAYRFENKGGHSFVYSGDTGFCDEIVEISKGCDLLILECSFPDGQKAEGHLTPSLAGSIASQSGVKKLMLIHFYPEVLSTDIVKECRKTYKGELILGRDLLRIRV